MAFQTWLNGLALGCAFALIAGCATTPKEATVSKVSQASRIVRAAMGTSLVGARGKTPADQTAIDETIAGPCAIGALTRSECARHREQTKPGAQ